MRMGPWTGIACLVLAFVQANAFLKFTNVYCEALDQSYGSIQKCEIKAVSRNVSMLNAYIKILKPLRKVHMHVQWFKKANGYRPWLYNYTADFCAFLKFRKHPVTRFIYDIGKDFTNLNGTCPIRHDIIVCDLHLDKLDLPFPAGDYRFSFHLTEFYKPLGEFHVYFTYT